MVLIWSLTATEFPTQSPHSKGKIHSGAPTHYPSPTYSTEVGDINCDCCYTEGVRICLRMGRGYSITGARPRWLRTYAAKFAYADPEIPRLPSFGLV